MPSSTSSQSGRPGLAIIANCVTPYRVHLHRLIAAGIPELQLHTLVSHGAADFDWDVTVPPEINVRWFGSPTDSPVAKLYHTPLREWGKGGRLISYLEQNDIRAVVCGMPRYLSYLRVVLHCHRVGLPAYVRSDANLRSEKPLRPLQQAIKSRYHSWWLSKVAGVMPMGQFGEQYFRKYGADPRRMYRVPYTPDYEYFRTVDPDRLAQFRQAHRLSDQRRHLLFSGRLVTAKRVDLLLDAFVQIAAQRPQWDLVIAGDGVLREELQRRVPESLGDRVRWLGFLECGPLALAYHACDVMVLPSGHEPWALVVQEAMAAGRVVVASDVVGAAHELVEDGVNGRIFESGNLQSLVDALLDVTEIDKLDQRKQRSLDALQTWIADLNPVSEIRRALTDAGVLATAAPAAATT